MNLSMRSIQLPGKILKVHGSWDGVAYYPAAPGHG